MSAELIDFNGLPETLKCYGGANGAKVCVVYRGDSFLIKYPAPVHSRKETDLSFSNACVSEHIGSRVFGSVGIPAQETILGVRKTMSGRNSLVVACRDFTRNDSLIFQDFVSLKNRTVAGTPRRGCGVELEEAEEAFRLQNALSPELLSDRFWDMFVVDALIGNWDRHNGNWGFLYNPRQNSLELAPVFDCGSSLYPLADEATMRRILDDPREMDIRIFDRPVSALTINGRKIRYFDFISSLENENCNAALGRIVPRVDLKAIDRLIDDTPAITDLQRDFYKAVLRARKERILDFSLARLQDRR